MNEKIPLIPTYRDLEIKLEELQTEHVLLGRRYDELTKLIRKKGKDSVAPQIEGDKFLFGYWS